MHAARSGEKCGMVLSWSRGGNRRDERTASVLFRRSSLAPDRGWGGTHSQVLALAARAAAHWAGQLAQVAWRLAQAQRQLEAGRSISRMSAGMESWRCPDS